MRTLNNFAHWSISWQMLWLCWNCWALLLARLDKRFKQPLWWIILRELYSWYRYSIRLSRNRLHKCFDGQDKYSILLFPFRVRRFRWGNSRLPSWWLHNPVWWSSRPRSLHCVELYDYWFLRKWWQQIRGHHRLWMGFILWSKHHFCSITHYLL